MEQNDQPIAAPKAQEKSGFFSKILKAVSVPVAAAAGFTVTYTEVRGNARKSAKQDGTLSDVVKDNEISQGAVIELRKAGQISKEEFLARSATNRDIYRKAADARLDHMGHGSFLKKFDYISRSNKSRAIIEGLAVTGIAIGAMFAVANSKVLDTMFSKKSDEDKVR